mgnify:CR=1 FL=1
MDLERKGWERMRWNGMRREGMRRDGKRRAEEDDEAGWGGGDRKCQTE